MVAVFNLAYLWFRRTDLFGDEYLLDLCGRFIHIDYERNIEKEMKKSIFMIFIVSIFTIIYNSSIYMEGMIGPMMAISISDSRQRMVYDVDLIFLFVLKVGMIFLGRVNQTGGYFLIDNINLLLLYLLPSILIYFVSELLVKIGGMGCGDPIIFSGLCVGVTLMELAYVFFGAVILAGGYCLISVLVEGDLQHRRALGAFICMSYIFV